MLQILQKSGYITKLLGTVLEETKNDIAILTSILNQHSVRVTNDPATKTLFKQNQENVPSFSVTIATISEHNQLAKKAISVVDEFKTYLKDSPEETKTDVIISALKEVAEFNNYLELNLCNGNGTTQNSLTHSEQIPPQPDGNRVDKAQSEGLPKKNEQSQDKHQLIRNAIKHIKATTKQAIENIKSFQKIRAYIDSSSNDLPDESTLNQDLTDLLFRLSFTKNVSEREAKIQSNLKIKYFNNLKKTDFNMINTLYDHISIQDRKIEQMENTTEKLENTIEDLTLKLEKTQDKVTELDSRNQKAIEALSKEIKRLLHNTNSTKTSTDENRQQIIDIKKDLGALAEEKQKIVETQQQYAETQQQSENTLESVVPIIEDLIVTEISEHIGDRFNELANQQNNIHQELEVIKKNLGKSQEENSKFRCQIKGVQQENNSRLTGFDEQLNELSEENKKLSSELQDQLTKQKNIEKKIKESETQPGNGFNRIKVDNVLRRIEEIKKDSSKNVCIFSSPSQFNSDDGSSYRFRTYVRLVGDRKHNIDERYISIFFHLLPSHCNEHNTFPFTSPFSFIVTPTTLSGEKIISTIDPVHTEQDTIKRELDALRNPSLNSSHKALGNCFFINHRSLENYLQNDGSLEITTLVGKEAHEMFNSSMKRKLESDKRNKKINLEITGNKMQGATSNGSKKRPIKFFNNK